MLVLQFYVRYFAGKIRNKLIADYIFLVSCFYLKKKLFLPKFNLD